MICFPFEQGLRCIFNIDRYPLHYIGYMHYSNNIVFVCKWGIKMIESTKGEARGVRIGEEKGGEVAKEG